METLSWIDLEEIVAQAVVNDSYADCNGPEAQRTFLRSLDQANEELFRLSRSENPDYGLPKMGEAYALWYHMRRVANVYAILSAFEEDLFRSSPSGQWRVLDVGAGTGAVSMALACWMYSRRLALADRVQTRVLCLEPEDPMVEVADFILRRVSARTGCRLPLLRRLKNLHFLEEAGAIPRGEVFELVIFSTTFDFVSDDAGRRSVIADVQAVLDRLLPDGLAIFLAPRVPQKSMFMEELSAVLKATKRWTRLRSGEVPDRDWPADGTPQARIAAAREYLRGESRRLGMEPAILSPSAANPYPKYRNDVEFRVFRREVEGDELGRRFRRELARERVARQRTLHLGGATPGEPA
ncbi:MAG TPA: class I SAM-dependent methyltransferase [Longimicrobium sp.]